MARRPFIAGNWKMNLGPSKAAALARELAEALEDDDRGCDIAIAPAAVSIPAVVAAAKGSALLIAGQDLHPEPSGAFTGAIAGGMLREAGCTYVIVGHSERRTLFGENDAVVGAKVRAAFATGLLPILCVGETLDERDADRAGEVVTRQLGAALEGLPADLAAAVTIAYEPVWAIGTGRTASPAQAQEMHAAIRSWLRSTFAAFVADDLRIQYGGSVKPDNAAELLAQPDIDGALVGGASLRCDSFVGILDGAGSGA